jgi:RpiB/LacA/LacB family sugar-phosphate isomerase
MTLYLAADHAGWKQKEALKPALTKLGITLQDLSPDFKKDDDYPAIGKSLATKTAKTAGARGILFCGSGVGMAIAANRVKGARAMEGLSTAHIKRGREHNDVNILTIGGWDQSPEEALTLIKTFLKTKASSAERHRRRVTQLG